MARFLLDTSVLIDHLRGHPEVVDRVRDLAQERHDLGICAINVAEIYVGVLEHERDPTEQLLSAMTSFELSHDTAQLAGELRNQSGRRGEKAALANMLIAAVAMTYDATLLTVNVKDFEISGLRVERLPVPS